MKVISQLCFAMEIRGQVRHLSGIKAYTPWRKYTGPILTKFYESSLLVNGLCNLNIRQNTAVSCFYFHFAA